MKKTLIVSLVVVIQCVVIGCLIWRYERIVRNGTEVRILCEAYDPYNPLMGRYLQLQVNPGCTNVAPEILAEKVLGVNRHDLYARLAPMGTNGLWEVAQVATAPQGDGFWFKPENVRIDHSLRWSSRRTGEDHSDFSKRVQSSPVEAVVRFPNEFFLNEKIAPWAEKILNHRDARSVVAVYRFLDGEIVITDVEVEGRSICEVAAEEMK